MEKYTFDNLPQVIKGIEVKLDIIYEIIKNYLPEKQLEKNFLTLGQAAEFLSISKQSLYNKVSLRNVPCRKRGKRLYFLKEELINWLDEGKKKTNEEIEYSSRTFLKKGKHMI